MNKTITYKATMPFLLILAVFGVISINTAHAGYTYGYYNNNYSYNSQYYSPSYGYNNYDNSYGYYNNYYNDYYRSYSPLRVSCYVTPVTARTGDTVTWSASVSGGNGSYTYTWSGTDGLSGYNASISRAYYNTGYKTASVTVVSGNQSQSVNCNGSVNIYDNNYYPYNNYYPPVYYPTTYYNNYYAPLTVSCSANVTYGQVGTPVTWNAYPNGGNGTYTFSWSGTDNIYGTGQVIYTNYNNAGLKFASVTVYSNGQAVTQGCNNSVTISYPYANIYPQNNYVQPYIVNTVRTVSTPPAPVVTKAQPVVETPAPVSQPSNQVASSVFSAQNVPWAWVAALVILVLFGTVLYLLFNKTKI